MLIRTIALNSCLALSLILSGCQSQAKVKATVSDLRLSTQVCDIWSPLTYDGKLDTPPTKAEIKINNAKHDAFCKQETKK